MGREKLDRGGSTPARQGREPLSRARVLAAAVALADAEGLPALTMRRLAADLGVEAMALYYHLPAKRALLDGVVDTVVDEILAATAEATGDDDLDWRARLGAQFLAARRVMIRHPWMPALLSTSTSIPAALYGYYDDIVATLHRAGFSYHLAHQALHTFGSLPLGFAQEIFSPSGSGGSLDPDVAEAEFAAMAAIVPHLTAMAASEIHDAADPTLGWCDGQTEFEFTVDLLLEALERRRDAAAGGP